MGTRNLVAVVMDGQFKVAQYGQWDGYIGGQGRTVLGFIKSMNEKKFRKALSECRFLSPDEIRQTWVEAGDKPDNTSGLISMAIADKHTELYPALSRDTGAQVLSLVQDGKVRRTVKNAKGQLVEKVFKVSTPVRGLQDGSDFASDHTFCEYAYLLDMDKRVLEIYCHGKGKGLLGKMVQGAIPMWKRLTFEECKEPDALQKLLKANGEKAD